MMNDEIACPFCAETIKAAAVVCRHCKTDLRKPARASAPVVRKSGFPVWIIVVIVCVAMVPILAVIAAIAIPGLLNAQRASNERNAMSSLKTVATGQTMFRAEDRDNNEVRDFWTGDVAGLYAINDFRIIELSIALADRSPCAAGALKNGKYAKPISSFGAPGPKARYWYRALIEDREAGERYGQDTDETGDRVHNKSRFGVCAMPESYGAGGRKVFIINENDSLYARDLGKAGFDANWPSAAELSSHWSKMD